jgi:hypothetical protein
MLAKVSIWFAMVCFVAALVFGALGTFGVGLSEPPPRSEDISERIVNNFETYEEDYLLWGRWIDLGWALGFAGLLIAAPFLPRVDRARHMLVAGAALAVAGDLIDLSKLAGIEIARIGLDNDLADNFAAGNVFRSAINATSTYVWITGLFLFAVGLLVLARDSTDRRWRGLSYVLAGSLVAVGITGPWTGSPFPEAATTLFTVALVLWGVKAATLAGDGIKSFDQASP